MTSVVLRQFRAWFELGGMEAQRLKPMEGLRAVAGPMVFCVHYASLAMPWTGTAATHALADIMHVLGNAGVDLFFVISGYLIYGGLARKPRPYGEFLLRRIQRLYPTFGVMLAIHLGVSFVAPGESKLPIGVVDAALYVICNALLLPGIFDIRPMMTIAWSLSYEMFFYLAVPLLIGLVRLRAWPRTARLACFPLLAVAMIFAPFAWPRMSLFVVGMFLAELLPIVMREDKTRFWLDPLTLLSLPVAGWLLVLSPFTGSWCVIVGVTCLLVTMSAFSHPGPISRFLVQRPLRWLGNASYSYYLVHGLVLKLLFVSFPKLNLPLIAAPWLFWVLLMPALLGTLLAAATLFLMVEKPFSIAASQIKHQKPRSLEAANATDTGN